MVYAIPANTAYTYDANSRPGFQKTYTAVDGAIHYAHWRYQVAYVENVTWSSSAFPYVYVSQGRSGADITSGNYGIDCKRYEIKPYTSTSMQYRLSLIHI